MIAGLLVIVICGSTLLSTVPIGLAQNSTSISGIITSNITWTKANSPYSLTGPTRIASDTTLTIEAGTVVNLNTYNIEVNGTLTAVGTRTNPIQLVGQSGLGGIDFSQSCTGSTIQNAIIYYTVIYISGSPRISDNTFSGLGSTSTIQVRSGSPIIENNIIRYSINVQGGAPIIRNNKIIGYTDNGLYWGDTTHMSRFGGSKGIVIEGGNVHISNNEISGGENGITINAGTVTIERNLFNPIAFVAISIGPNAQVRILNDTFTKDSCGISGVTSQTVINFNIENTYGVDISVGKNGTIDATNNWWGTTDTTVIAGKIQDGQVNFTPFLSAKNPQALPDSVVSELTPLEPPATPEPQKATMITISAPTGTVTRGTMVTISGTVVQDSIGLANMAVRLTAVNLNGNMLEIGTAATDASGIYSVDWMPVVEGTYSVTAEFRGTSVYSPSSAATQVTIGSASTETPTATTTATPVFSSSPTQTTAPSATPSPSQNPTLLPIQTSGALTQSGFNVVDGALLVGMISIICVVAVLLVIMFKKR